MSYVYKELLNKNGQTVYLRTPLSAIDMITTNGIQVNGNTMSVVFATKEQINVGAQGQIITASGLKEAMAQFDNVLYVGGGGINIKGGTVYAEPAPILSVLTGTEDRADCITNAVLNGAINLGRAVDVTTFPVTRNSFTATNYIETFEEDGVQVTDNCIQLVKTNPTNNSYYFYSWITIPKFAPGLKYLIMTDIQNRGTSSVIFELGTLTVSKIKIDNVVCAGTLPEFDSGGGTWLRTASLYKTDSQIGFVIKTTSTADIDIRLKHYMVFEVTSLSDEAIYALATMPHPEKIYEKYLVRQDAVCPWIPVINMQYSPAVTIGAGLVYKLIANDGQTHTLSVDTFPAHTYGKDSYITVFVGDTSNIVVQPPLVLMDPLTPNAVNNCVVKFRDGYARIYVSDTDYGYTITVTSGSASGSLKYGIQTSTEEYIVIANQLDGERISFDGAVAPSGRKTNILGHGTDKTILTGSVSLTPTVEMHALSLADVNVTGGTMIVPSGVEMNNGTTTVSAGLLAIDGGVIGSNGNVVVSGGTLSCREAHMSSGTTISMVSGTNGVIDVTKLVGDSECVVDLGGKNVEVPPNAVISLSGCVVSSGSAEYGGVFNNFFDGTGRKCTIMMSGVVFSKNSVSYRGGVCYINRGTTDFSTIKAISCTFTSNNADNNGGVFYLQNNGVKLSLSGCHFDVNTPNAITATNGAIVSSFNCAYMDSQNIVFGNNASLELSGSNTIKSLVYATGSSATVTISSDATLDLTGNTVTTPISPGGGIIIQDNVHILYNHTSTGTTLPTSSVTEISGGTYGGITNYGVLMGPVSIENGGSIVGNGETVVDLSSTHVVLNGVSANASGLVFSSGSSPNWGMQFYVSNGGYLAAESCSFVSASVINARHGTVNIATGASAYLKGCVFSGNATRFGGTPAFVFNGKTVMVDCAVSDNIENLDTTKPVGAVGGTQNVFSGCSFGLNQHVTVATNGILNLSGSNTTLATVVGSGSVTLTSGAILDLRGNNNPTPIAPGGGITFAAGGATVTYTSGTGSKSYTMNNIRLTAGAKLTNTEIVDISSTTGFSILGGVSGVTFVGHRINFLSGAVVIDAAVATLGSAYIYSGATVSGFVANSGGRVSVLSGAVLNELVIKSGGSLSVASGASALLVTSNTGANVTVQTGGYITYK